MGMQASLHIKAQHQGREDLLNILRINATLYMYYQIFVIIIVTYYEVAKYIVTRMNNLSLMLHAKCAIHLKP